MTDIPVFCMLYVLLFFFVEVLSTVSQTLPPFLSVIMSNVVVQSLWLLFCCCTGYIVNSERSTVERRGTFTVKKSCAAETLPQR